MNERAHAIVICMCVCVFICLFVCICLLYLFVCMYLCLLLLLLLLLFLLTTYTTVRTIHHRLFSLFINSSPLFFQCFSMYYPPLLPFPQFSLLCTVSLFCNFFFKYSLNT